MLGTIVNLFLIEFIIVNIIDVSGFIGELEGMLAKWLDIKSAKRTLDQVPNTQETSVPDSTQKVQKVIKAQNTHTKVSIPKPFSCSYCSCWWVGLIYLIATGNFTLYYIAALLFICALTGVTKDMVYLVIDIITKIITIINKLL